MKHKWLIAATIIISSTHLFATDAVNFTDENLHRAILEQVDSNGNRQIERNELADLSTLNLYDEQLVNSAPIASLIGLKNLDISNNQFSNLSIVAFMKNLTTLGASRNSITNIEHIQNLTNLEQLHLNDNKLINIYPLATLTKLRTLYINNNNISDITSLSELKNLVSLNVSNNKISNISSLANLTNLEELNLANNQISDIAALENLTNLNYVNLSGNPLNIRDAKTLEILNNLKNGGARIVYDSEIPKNAKTPVVSTSVATAKFQNYLADIAPTPLPNLSYKNLDNLEDADDLIVVLEAAMAELTTIHFVDEYITEVFTQFAEEAIEQMCYKRIHQNTLTIDSSTVAHLADDANTIADALPTVFALQGLELNRPIEKTVSVATKGNYKANVTLDPSLTQLNINSIKIITTEAEIIVDIEDLPNTPVTISMTRKDNSNVDYEGVDYDNSSYIVTSTPTIPLKIGLRLADEDDPQNQAILRDGINEGGKYNPATNKIEASSKQNGAYTVEITKPRFKDLTTTTKQMRTAIELVAAKGIMNGVAEEEFAPNEIVLKKDLVAILENIGYSAAAALESADPLLRIDMVATITQALLDEQKYLLPLYPANYLVDYADMAAIPDWAAELVALATREDLIPIRIDGNFAPNEPVTRGELAIALKLLFDRIGN